MDEKQRSPTSSAEKGFLMSKGKIILECTLDKEIYYHGQELPIHVCIHNNSSKSVKAIRVSSNYLAVCPHLTIFISRQIGVQHLSNWFFLKNGPSPASFSLYSSFQYTVDSKHMFNINKFLLMSGFELRTFGIGSDLSTN